MSFANYKIEKYSDGHRNQVLAVWEKSVLATHTFLTPSDFKELKLLMQTIDFKKTEIFCITHEGEISGFISVAEQKIEMLFLSPEYIGKGLGKLLADFAISTLNADKVDVNEQNTHAVKFYESLGFKPFERTDIDDQGKEYPLLRMKLEPIN